MVSLQLPFFTFFVTYSREQITIAMFPPRPTGHCLHRVTVYSHFKTELISSQTKEQSCYQNSIKMLAGSVQWGLAEVGIHIPVIWPALRVGSFILFFKEGVI